MDGQTLVKLRFDHFSYLNNGKCYSESDYRFRILVYDLLGVGTIFDINLYIYLRPLWRDKLLKSHNGIFAFKSNFSGIFWTKAYINLG